MTRADLDLQSRNILIAGGDYALQSYFLAHCARTPALRATLLVDARDNRLAERVCEYAQMPGERLSVVSSNPHAPIEISGRIESPVHAVWWFGPLASAGGRLVSPAARELVRIAALLGAAEFNLVMYASSGGNGSDDVRQQLLGLCTEADLRFHIFHTASLVDRKPAPFSSRSGGFVQFLLAVHELKTEIEQKFPEYFEYNALRCYAEPAALVNLLPAGSAMELMSRIAEKTSAAGQSYYIGSPDSQPLSEVCERLGSILGLSLLVADEPEQLNAVDRVLQSSANDFLMSCRPEAASVAEIYEAAGVPMSFGAIDDMTADRIFEAIIQDLDAKVSVEKRSVAAFQRGLTERSISRNGESFTYAAAGTDGPSIVILNALGQRAAYWLPLMERLAAEFRVIIWDPRIGDRIGLNEQIEDVQAVLSHEGIETCHLLGWCTGPKLAVEFYVRNPSTVRSMVFLNSTFKCAGSSDELETEYEHNFEGLCRVLDARPQMVSSIRKSLHASVEQESGGIAASANSVDLAIAVLSMTNPGLRAEILSPFRDEPTTLSYARQSIDFWKFDTGQKAAQVQIPVLFIAAEYDKIALPAASAAMAKCFPKARYVEIAGATHYCLYDRPGVIAGLIQSFLREPDGFLASGQASTKSAI